VQQFGGENVDGVDFAMFSQNVNKFADTKWFGDDDTQTRKQIQKDSLESQTDSHSSDADAGNQRKNLNAELLQHNQ
jgi:hypothetical protein